MRSYPTDSPEATARVLALIVIADGGVSASELALVPQRAEQESLPGVDAALMDRVLRELCEDLQMVSRRRWGRELEPALIEPLLDEVRAPRLRADLLQLGYAIVQADGVLSDGEGRLLAHLYRRWRADDWAIAA